MKSFEQWMDEYGVSHNHPINQLVHKVCVPLIMLTVIGFLWKIPRPDVFNIAPFMNWGTIFIFLCLIFYLSLNFWMFLGMTLQAFFMSFICHELDQRGYLLSVSVFIFVLAWIGQFWGHKIEGKRPSFLKDLIFLLIGPLWVMRFLYKKIGFNI